MKTLLGAACLALALGGCSLFADDKAQAAYAEQLSIAATCKGVGISLRELAPHRAKLDAKAQGVVAGALKVTDPVCDRPTAPTATELASTALVAAAGRLSTVVALFK